MMYHLQGLADIVYGGDDNYQEYYDAWKDTVDKKIIPGLAFPLLFGNLWYAWMAVKLAQTTNKMDVCAQPFGVNTPGAFVFIYSVCLPVMFSAKEDGMSPDAMAKHVWQVGCSAGFIGGIIECVGAIFAGPIREHMAMAAIMGPIAGIGLMWLGFGPMLDIMQEPIIGFIPFAFAFSGFYGEVRYFDGLIPFGIFVMGISAIFQWVGAGRWSPNTLDELKDKFNDAVEQAGESEISMEGLGAMDDVGDFMNVVFPIALNNFVGTMMCVESSKLAGDNYPLAESMLVDGWSTMISSLFGCVLPTTVYIGHPFYKGTGGGRGYVLLNGFFMFLLCIAGVMPVVQACISITGAHCILLCVGFLIVSQTMEMTAPRHYPALCVSLCPIIADYISKSYGTEDSELYMGLTNLGVSGGILLSMIYTQITCELIDRKYLHASFYALISIVLSLFGVLHANNTVWYDGDIEKDNETVDIGEAAIAAYTKLFTLDDIKRYCEGWRFCVGYAM
eukprot:UN30234